MGKKRAMERERELYTCKERESYIHVKRENRDI
jgi:hypothetical protein